MATSDGRRQHPALPAELSAAVAAAREKKAADLVALDLRDSSAFTDFFLLATGQNVRQLRAIADAIVETEKARGLRPSGVEGYDRAEWILLDYFDFVVHLFTPEARGFYGLERLWGSATRIPLPEPAPAAIRSANRSTR